VKEDYDFRPTGFQIPVGPWGDEIKLLTPQPRVQPIFDRTMTHDASRRRSSGTRCQLTYL